MKQFIPAPQMCFTFSELNLGGYNTCPHRFWPRPSNYTSSYFSTIGGTFLILLRVGYFKYLLLTAMLFFFFYRFLLRGMLGITKLSLTTFILGFILFFIWKGSDLFYPESSSDFPAVCAHTQQALDCYLALYAPCCLFEIVSYLFFILSSFITFRSFHHHVTELPSQSNGLTPW